MTIEDTAVGPRSGRALEPPPPPPPGRQPDTDNGSLPLLLAFCGFFLALGVFRSWWIPGIIAGLLFMLFMHELGHYVTARASGMKVTEFFLGFGPKIWSFNRGETEYGVKAIPAGAYVRIIGMTNLDEIDEREEHRTYRAQPYWQRMVTICAGSTMHFLMALVALIVLFGAYNYQGFYGPPWQVDPVVPGSSAERIGLEVGDKIDEVNGETFRTWEDFGDFIAESEPGPVRIVVDRAGEQVVLEGELGAQSGDVVGVGFGLVINEDRASQGWTVASVTDGSSAGAIGVEVDDVLLRADGIGRPTQRELGQLLLERDGDALDLVVLRDGAEVALSGTVELDRSTPFRAFLGVGPRYVDSAQPGWGESLGLAFEDFATVAGANLGGLIDLLNPLNWIDSLGEDEPTAAPSPAPTVPVADEEDEGPRPISIIGIARLFAESESVDEALFLFMFVNIFIGIFNLVPLLPLDGGHAAIATYERGRQLVTGRPYRVDAAKLIPITWVVIIGLVMLGMWAAFLDVFSWPA